MLSRSRFSGTERWMVMGMRNKLYCLIHSFVFAATEVSDMHLAEYLITNGVRIPVRCKDCKHSYKSSGSSTRYRCECWGVYDIDCEVTPEHFCSYGERRTVSEDGK